MDAKRLEAFSDGVIAIIITIMVLELRAPHEHELTALRPLFPVFLSYVLSFIYLGIYWNNHHHMLHVTRQVSGAILWANLHLLFWLSLIPFTTAWIGETTAAPTPTALYGVVLLAAAIAYTILQYAIVAKHGRRSLLASAIGRDLKGTASLLMYGVAIPASYFNVWIANALYVLVALIWLVPDRRIERALAAEQSTQHEAA
ncbi:MAG TPA: TMEM175 family protein [Gemmatimonadales bacterium]|jgi:uncharacterized membrane protein|nr:TMEM175 family protein [Gemmatimonadales bacterium]